MSLEGKRTLTPERLADALVAHAHAKEGEIGPKLAHGRQRNAALVGGAGTGGNEHAARLERADLVDGELVVLDDVEVDAQVAQVL